MSAGGAILDGIRVIDCGTYIAGPAAATALSDFGAEVIKVERPPHGDPYRYIGRVPGMPVSETEFCWILDSRNKKSIALNVADPAGRDVLLRLVATADVFVTNFQPQMIARFRIGYEELRTVNERLIYAGVTGYGELGAEAEKPGYDITAYWARSGLMSQMHSGDAEPCLSVCGFGDHPTAMSMFGAILLGLYHRERTGRGLHVSTSLIASGAWSNSCLIQAQLCGAEFLKRRTRKHPQNPTVNHYHARDGQRFLLCLLDPHKEWERLGRAIERPELAGDPRFASPQARRANSAELVAILDAEFERHDMAEWARRFEELDLVWSPVPNMDQVGRDPQMRANGVLVPIEDSDVLTVSSPITAHGVEKVPARGAPGVGQHTREVLVSLGYEEEAIRSLLDRGVALAPPPDTEHSG